MTLHITFNSIINLGAGVPHAVVYRLSIDFTVCLLPGPIGQIIHVFSGKRMLLIKNQAQVLHSSAANLKNEIKHSVVNGVVDK